MGPHAGQPVLEAGMPLGQAPVVVIMVHGRNAGPANILDLVPRLARPDVTYLAPAAAGRTWYPHSFMADIASIDGLLAENKTLLEKLRKQSKKSAARIAALEGTVAELERSLAEKDTEIMALKERLASTDSSLATLIDMYRDKSQLADMQRNEMNTAWYAVGTAKELRAKGVLTKEGGVVGIGAVDKLNTENLTQSSFTRIDVVQTLEIPIMAKKAKLATSHPAASYRLEGADKLVITDPNAFWSLSRYLVIVAE